MMNIQILKKYDERVFRDGENILTLPKASVKQLNLFCSFIFCCSLAFNG